MELKLIFKFTWKEMITRRGKTIWNTFSRIMSGGK